MHGKTIAFLESRLADHVGELIARRGGVPLSAPALAEEPAVDPVAIERLLADWSKRAAAAIVFQTGVGTRALFAATDALGVTDTFKALLERTTVIARGPKPTAALRQRSVRIDRSAAEPYTTAEVLDAMASLELRDAIVVVQRYGDVNAELHDALTARGATIVDVPLYRWTLPTDIAPLLRLIDALERREVDAVAFTSASQVGNLFAVAESAGRVDALRGGLARSLVASIGPVSSRALRAAGVTVAVEASPPKLGPLMEALDRSLRD
jgi:uroporphyrinogen-III synthase